MKKRDRKSKHVRQQKREIDIIGQRQEPKRQYQDREFRAQKRRIKENQEEKRTGNREFAKITYFFVALFLAMMGYLVYFNIVKSKDIINSPYNVRLDSMADRVIRGKILDKDGNVLAETKVDEDGTETRNYPYGNLYAHVVGYDSHGKSGIESAANFELLTSNAFFAEKLIKEFQEKKNTGDNVVTTLDTELQQAASKALGSYKGAVVVLEVTTGKVLTMVSKPDFDPNTVAENWKSLISDEQSVLLNRATHGAYAPGSIFKLVTTLAYMRQESDFQDYHYNCESEIEYEGTVIHCAKNRKHGEQDLRVSLANSCNTSYSNIGLELNLNRFRAVAESLLFNKKLPNILPYSQSKFQLDSKSSTSEVMMTAIGQGKTQVSPYHMALLAAGIANGGVIMEPYLVDRVESYVGAKIEKTMPKIYAEIMNSKEASQLKEYMKAVVEEGTARALKNNDYTVAGKTGTAEYSSDKEKVHSWFMGFTNMDNPEIAISVVIESADNSGMSAVTVAKKVLDAYYD